MDEFRVRGLDTRQLDTQALCALVSERHRSLVDLECELLELAALWADHYSCLPDVEDAGPVLPGAEKLKLFGGEGTPLVWEFAQAEFGALQQMSMYAASTTVANALDLRHRLPLIWARVQAGEVRTWQACKVADATHGLSPAAAGFVDRAVGRRRWGSSPDRPGPCCCWRNTTTRSSKTTSQTLPTALSTAPPLSPPATPSRPGPVRQAITWVRTRPSCRTGT